MKERKNKSVLGSTFARIVAFLLLAVSAMAVFVGSYYMLFLKDYFALNQEDFVRETLKTQEVYQELGTIVDLYNEGNVDSLERRYHGKNVSLKIMSKDVKTGEVLGFWFNQDYQQVDSPYTYYWNATRYRHKGLFAGDMSENEVLYEIEFTLDPLGNWDKEYENVYLYACMIFHLRYLFLIMVLAGVSLFFVCFIFLMCSAGHKNGSEGIVPSVLKDFFLDFLGIVGLLGISMLALALEFVDPIFWNHILDDILAVFLVGFGTVWCTIVCMELAVRIKLGNWWKQSACYYFFRWLGRVFKFLKKVGKGLLSDLPASGLVIGAYLLLSAGEAFGLAYFDVDGLLLVIWFVEKVFLFVILIHLVFICGNLQQGSEELATGNLTYHLDTTKMYWRFREHGENLNRIGEGISNAVEQKMKSERLKTELITNVSHDIKTPLTSIINYADLLEKEVENPVNVAEGETSDKEEKIKEYTEVLLRQSRRLKNLLENLLEASKAATGNIEVVLDDCELGVFISQVISEYEQRFQEKNLLLIEKIPEEIVKIKADGRHLWRVFDNLLNNIYKYAQGGSRVYLSVERIDRQVRIIFRNMSEFPLEISPQELEERFVRGDKSRNLEGNGLGLSIAKSLVELQEGTLEIVTDGDLFKVILAFPVL